jgi:proteasome lid subunit RPN8/RPN11
MEHRLTLPDDLRSQLLAAARAALPYECCGLLEGVRDGETVRVVALHPAVNVSPDPETGFEIDPAAHFSLQRALRGTGRAVVGCYHSHPNGRAEPSGRDRAGGCEDGWVWLIIATGVIDRLAAFEAPDFTPLAL